MSELLIGTGAVDHSPVTLSLSGLLHHTLIVGQSGSGKSFFVARLVEEILLRTGARVVALDPNGDLRNLDQVDMSALSSRRDELHQIAASRQLESFDTPDAFEQRWVSRRMVFLNSAERATTQTRQVQQRIERRRLTIDWATIDDDQDALLQLDSHSRPTQLLGIKACRELVGYSQSAGGLRLADTLRGLADAADKFAQQNINMYNYEYAKHLTPTDWSNVRARFLDLLSQHRVWTSEDSRTDFRSFSLSDYVDAPFTTYGAVADWNALVIGLDAARHPDALLAASVTLGRLWSQARNQARRTQGDDNRAPTFVVIDEAHNFAPASSDDFLRRRVSEKILQIASEGRKYGLYLILATQRPTKLHPELVPECENSCVLRVQSDRELRFAGETLGIPDARVANASRFTQGQGLLAGRWVGGDVVDILSAPARTQVGGGGLSDQWTDGPRTIEIADSDLDRVRDAILQLLRSSPGALKLVDIANIVRQDDRLDVSADWAGCGTLKGLLTAASIPGLRFATTPPGYAYLVGVHAAPPDNSFSTTDRSEEVQNSIRLPRLELADFVALFEAIADEVAVNPFSLTETSKAVRDNLREAGRDIGRGAVNFILSGLRIGGHDFSSDRPQDPLTLARDFSRGFHRQPDLISPADTTLLAKILEHIETSGALGSPTTEDDAVTEARDADAEDASAQSDPAPSVEENERPPEAD